MPPIVELPLIESGASTADINYPFPPNGEEGELAFYQWGEATTTAAPPPSW